MVIQSGRIVVTEYRNGATRVNVYPSIKEMVQSCLAENAWISPDGCWGSEDHVKALEETKDLLDRTVAKVREAFERDRLGEQ